MTTDPQYERDFEREVAQRAATEAVRVGLRAAGDASLSRFFCSRESVQISISVIDEDEMRGLNTRYRGVDKPTDVLSFSTLESPSPDAPPLPLEVPAPLGDVVLCLPYLSRQAEELGHSRETEVAWLTIHGTLQLLGYEHATEESARGMESLELEALGALGLHQAGSR